jgi:hypothetical protein
MWISSFQSLRCRLHFFLVAIGQDHRSTGLRECLGRRKPQPRARARNECYFLVKRNNHASSPLAVLALTPYKRLDEKLHDPMGLLLLTLMSIIHE